MVFYYSSNSNHNSSNRNRRIALICFIIFLSAINFMFIDNDAQEDNNSTGRSRSLLQRTARYLRILSSMKLSQDDLDTSIDVMGYISPDIKRKKKKLEKGDIVESGTNIDVDDEDEDEPVVNILALGGSVTYGNDVNWNTAYSNVLGNMFDDQYITHVDNLAIRASGAQIPSMCISSMINGDVLVRTNQTSPVSSMGSKEREYDLILIEFSLNGFDGLEVLVKRLRDRYPSAIIVYLQLMSKQGVIEFGNDGGRVEFLRMPPKIIKYLQDNGVIFYNFPRYQLQSGNYESDEKHLNRRGHGIVADGLYELVGEKLLEKKKIDYEIKKQQGQEPQILPGTWGEHGGDQCYFWFQGGNIPNHITNKLLRIYNEQEEGNNADYNNNEQHEMTEFSRTKFAYETNQGETTRFDFFYDARKQQEQSPDGKIKLPTLRLVHMTTGLPSLYPDAHIIHYHHKRIPIQEGQQGQGQQDATNTKEIWEYVKTTKVGSSPTANHITEASVIGQVKPGWNRIFVKPLTEGQENKTLPFRTVGLVMSNWDYNNYHIVGKWNPTTRKETMILKEKGNEIETTTTTATAVTTVQ